jgi:hypothetical protein
MMTMTAMTESLDSEIFLTAPVRGEIEAHLEDLKQRLLMPIIRSIADSNLARDLSWAANEAAALAWCTICPVLVLPDLLEEKIQDAFKRWEKQQQILKH